MSELLLSPPVLSCAAAAELERQLFGGDEAKEWTAMQAAGRAVANALLHDFAEIGLFPPCAQLLLLVGKGHNGGDALIAARTILERFPAATAEVVFVFGERTLRPLAARAWRELAQSAGPRISRGNAAAIGRGSRGYDVCLDGIFGFQFRPPADARVAALADAVNASPIRLRAAVDLPSADLVRADFTYATGSVKTPLLTSDVAGRIRYLDLGFFAAEADANSHRTFAAEGAEDRVLTADLLDPWRRLRPMRSDKRHYGHVFLVGGSRGFPGAVFMAAAAAVRSGAGLVTAFVPESLAPAFAAQLPEAIWVGWPETPDGSLALEGEHLLKARIERANALVVGPGIGRDRETLALMQNLVATSPVPLVIDADALQPEIVSVGAVKRVVTPHAGELKRIAGETELRAFAADPKLTVVAKGPLTRVAAQGTIYHAFVGGPVLARGGSGDILAGMIGTQLAQLPDDPTLAAARAVIWHGLAADELARAHGQVAVHITQLLDFLPTVLRA